MKSHWLAYTVVAVLGALAGVLVAGAPDLSAASATIVATTAPDGGSSDEAPASSEPTDTTDSTESPTTTAPPTTTERATTTTTTVDPIPDRADISVVAANGANIAGIAADTAEALRLLGYTDVRETTGTEIFGGTVIYYADGFDQAANRLVDDLGYTVPFVVPIDGQTPIDAEFGDADIIVYLGQDRG
jgi:hypothetical protein